MRMAAVFTLSVSTVGLRTRAIPRWVAYLGYAVALVLLVAAGEHRWSQLIFPLWVLLLSVVILLTRPRDRTATPSRPALPRRRPDGQRALPRASHGGSSDDARRRRAGRR